MSPGGDPCRPPTCQETDRDGSPNATSGAAHLAPDADLDVLELRAPPGSPPAVALLYELAGTMVRAAAAGELRTAQAIHATLGALLGGPPDDQRGAEGAPVVDLVAARARRDRGRSG